LIISFILWNVEVGIEQPGKNAGLLQLDCQTPLKHRNLLSPYFHDMPEPEEPVKFLKEKKCGKIHID
jgi:hypothetical protein